jgi:hypothetical protein
MSVASINLQPLDEKSHYQLYRVKRTASAQIMGQAVSRGSLASIKRALQDNSKGEAFGLFWTL